MATDARQRPVLLRDTRAASFSPEQVTDPVLGFPSTRSRSSVDTSTPKPRLDSAARLASDRLYVVVSPAAFRVCWIVIWLFHGACFAFGVCAAYIYAKLPPTMLAYLITVKKLAIDVKYFPCISNLYAIVATGHGFLMVNMLVASIVNRRLTFYWWPKTGKATGIRRGFKFRSISSVVPTAASTIDHFPCPTTANGKEDHSQNARSGPTVSHVQLTSYQKIFLRTRDIIEGLFGRTGLFGVNGHHFESIMLIRELCEASLQAVQAYELARLLPRLALVRTYVCMLVINCWSTLLLHHLFDSSESLQRILCLVCDLVLDYASSIGVWTVLAYRYIHQYDPVQTSFPLTSLTDDVWYVTFINDFRLVLISSWVDLGSQAVYFISIFNSINDVKLLLRRSHNGTLNWGSFLSIHTPGAARIGRRNSVDPHHAIRNSTDAVDSLHLDAKIKATFRKKRIGSITHRVLQSMIAILGGAILIIHLYAETRPAVPGCRLTVLTWMRSQSGCALLNINCHKLGITGHKLEIAEELNKVAATSLEQVSLVHCSTLEIPPMIQTLHQLCVLKIYNATIVEWGGDAALSNEHHPDLGVLILARVNTTDRELPAGLQSPSFPQSLVSIQLSVVNIVTLPTNLKWPSQLSLFWEASSLGHVPPAIMEMPIGYLSLADNGISELPIRLFRMNLVVVNLSKNPLQELVHLTPDTQSTKLFGSTILMQISETNISSLPDSLVSAMLAGSGQIVYAYKTPICTSLQSNIQHQTTDNRLKALYTSGWISCWTGEPRNFPIVKTDAMYKISD